MIAQLLQFLRDEDGASAVEYGLIIGLIAVALVVVLLAVGGPEGLGGLFQTIADELKDAQTS